jgi:hypothetical protein
MTHMPSARALLGASVGSNACIHAVGMVAMSPTPARDLDGDANLAEFGGYHWCHPTSCIQIEGVGCLNVHHVSSVSAWLSSLRLFRPGTRVSQLRYWHAAGVVVH